MSERKLELMSLASITGADRNPKRHASTELGKSIGRFGYVEPVVLDERTGRLVAGHGRVEALRVERHKAGKPPEGVVEKDGEWFLPVLRGWSSRSDAEASAYLVASNRLTELGGWDEAELGALLKELSEQQALEGVGFDEEQLREALDAAGLSADATDDEPVFEDEGDALAKELGVRRGQLWSLGRHRLLCGDSTNADDVSRALNGETPLIMVTDPPYGVEYDSKQRNENTRQRKILSDDIADWSDAWKLFPGSVAYVWCAGTRLHVVAQSLVDSSFELRSLLVWAKSSIVLTRGHYHWQTEHCWYASRGDKSSRWCGGRKQSTLWEIEKPSASETGHPTQKPVECMARPIRNHECESVYEPFSGSGTTIVACEKLGKRCIAIELDPAHVARTIRRFENMTGVRPTLSVDAST